MRTRSWAAEVVYTAEASHDARAAAGPAHRSGFDSLLFIGSWPSPSLKSSTLMTRSIIACLLTRPASSQAVAPLAPTVVRLEVSDVARCPLIGLGTATCRSPRQCVAAANQLLLVRADRSTALTRGRRSATRCRWPTLRHSGTAEPGPPLPKSTTSRCGRRPG